MQELPWPQAEVVAPTNVLLAARPFSPYMASAAVPNIGWQVMEPIVPVNAFTMTLLNTLAPVIPDPFVQPAQPPAT